MPPGLHTDVAEIPQFEQHLAAAVQALQVTLRTLLASVGANPRKPQDVARRFDLDKNLTWKVAKIVAADQPYAVVAHLPGAAGIDILLAALQHAGATTSAVQAVRAAYAEFERVIAIHAGDRATLNLTLESMAAEHDVRGQVACRKLAFRGNSGIWGIQARVRTTTAFLAPNRDRPHLLDMGLIGGFCDIRRLRRSACWPLFRIRRYNDDGTPVKPSAGFEPLDPAFSAPDGPHLVGDFCSPHMPPLEATTDERGVVYRLGAGPVGKTGAFDCFFGHILRAGAGRYRDEHNLVGEVFSIVNVPVETLIFDIFTHADVRLAQLPEALVYGRLSGDLDEHTQRSVHDLLPVREPLVWLPQPTAENTPLVPRYPELFELACRKGGWRPDDFVGARLVLPYPPMPATVVLRFPLPAPPGGAGAHN